MKKTFLLTVFVALSTIVFAQESKIENTRLQLEGDKLVITYDLSGAKPLENVWLEIKTTSNKEIFAHTLSGDINKTVYPGKSKQIVWDMKADGIDLQGEELNVKVLAVKPAGSVNTLTEITEVVRGKQWKNRDIVHYKNGSKIEGRIDKRFALNNLRMVVTDGNTITLKVSDIDKIQNKLITKDSIYLKNGDVLAGRISEINPTNKVVILSNKRNNYSVQYEDIRAINTNYSSHGIWKKNVFFMPVMQMAGAFHPLYGARVGLLNNVGCFAQFSYWASGNEVLSAGISKYVYTLGSIDFHATGGLSYYSNDLYSDADFSSFNFDLGLTGHLKHFVFSTSIGIPLSGDLFSFSLGLGYSFSIK